MGQENITNLCRSEIATPAVPIRKTRHVSARRSCKNSTWGKTKFVTRSSEDLSQHTTILSPHPWKGQTGRGVVEGHDMISHLES